MSGAGGGRMSRRQRSVERCRVMWASKLRPCPYESPWPNAIDAAGFVAHRIAQDERIAAAYVEQTRHLVKAAKAARQGMLNAFDAAYRAHSAQHDQALSAITAARRALATQLAPTVATEVFAAQLETARTVEDTQRW